MPYLLHWNYSWYKTTGLKLSGVSCINHSISVYLLWQLLAGGILGVYTIARMCMLLGGIQQMPCLTDFLGCRVRFETAYGLASIYLSMFAWCELLRKQYATWEEAWNAPFDCSWCTPSLDVVSLCYLMLLNPFWRIQVSMSALIELIYVRKRA